MGLPQSSPNEDEKADLDSIAKELQGQPQPSAAMGLPQSSRNEHEEEDSDTSAEEAQKQPGPFEPSGVPQSSPQEDEEEELDTSAEEPQEEPRPFEALGLPQSSPLEEELDTIAEEPVAEARASEKQGSHPQPLERPSEGFQQQQAPQVERGLGTRGEQSTDDQSGSHVHSKRGGSQPKAGAGVAGAARDAWDSRGAGDGNQVEGVDGGVFLCGNGRNSRRFRRD